MRNYYKLGSWNVHCMVCGKKCKSDHILKRWDGLLVCKEDYETRHPMDFLRARKERLSVPFAFHAADNTFIDIPYVDCCDEVELVYADDATPVTLITGQSLVEDPLYVDCPCIEEPELISLTDGTTAVVTEETAEGLVTHQTPPFVN